VLSSFHRLSRTRSRSHSPTTRLGPGSSPVPRITRRPVRIAWLLRLCGICMTEASATETLPSEAHARRNAIRHRASRAHGRDCMERNADKAVELLGAHFRATTDVILHAGFVKTGAASPLRSARQCACRARNDYLK